MRRSRLEAAVQLELQRGRQRDKPASAVSSRFRSFSLADTSTQDTRAPYVRTAYLNATADALLFGWLPAATRVQHALSQPNRVPQEGAADWHGPWICLPCIAAVRAAHVHDCRTRWRRPLRIECRQAVSGRRPHRRCVLGGSIGACREMQSVGQFNEKCPSTHRVGRARRGCFRRPKPPCRN